MSLEGLTLMAPAWAMTQRVRRRAVQITSRVMMAAAVAVAGLWRWWCLWLRRSACEDCSGSNTVFQRLALPYIPAAYPGSAHLPATPRPSPPRSGRGGSTGGRGVTHEAAVLVLKLTPVIICPPVTHFHAPTAPTPTAHPTPIPLTQ